ncbi:MAG TPA: hypothetical protein VGC91_08755 [Pyrinomonadaceae bacterium]|jgi:DNA-directed RNA polymerase subunit RPC12/RpoP
MEVFSCPQCGASLESEPIKGSTVECPYCHSAVIVPPELRPAPPPSIHYSPPPVFSGYEPPSSRQNLSFVRVVALCVVLIFGFMLLMLFVWNPKSKTSTYSYRPPTPPTIPNPPPAGRLPNDYALTFGGEGTGQGLFKDAQEVAVDGAGNIYVSDDTLRIQKFDSQGKFLSLWTIPQSTEYYSKVRGGPARLLADREGRVYAVIGGVVLKFDGATGEALGAAHGTDYIVDAALKADGGMAVVSAKGEDDELVILDAKGKATKRVHQFISSQLDKRIPVEAVKVAVDGVGNVFGIYALGSVYGEFYYDNEDLAVFRFTADGRYVNRFSGGGKEPGQFESPNAIAVDSQGDVYVSDLTVGIHVFSPDGRYLKKINAPFWTQSMAFDAAGNLFVVGDNKVAKIELR